LRKVIWTISRLLTVYWPVAMSGYRSADTGWRHLSKLIFAVLQINFTIFWLICIK